MSLKKVAAASWTVSLLAGGSLLHADEGFYGKAKAYYIDTTKKSGSTTDVDASALAAGGQLGYKKTVAERLDVAVTAMGTYGIGNDTDEAKVDKSVLSGSYNGDDSISVIGEAYVQYRHGNSMLSVGRQTLNTPLAAAKEVRMLPTTFEAAVFSNRDIPGTIFTAAHVTGIKQRNSDRVYSMGRNALGDSLKSYTGESDTGVSLLAVNYSGLDGVTLQAWDYYAHEILNAVYLQGDFKGAVTDGMNWHVALQYLDESSIGKSDDYLKSTGVSGIDATLGGAKATIAMEAFSVGLAMTRTAKNSSAHDAIVAPWDGTPAFTNTITGNNLEKSQYGAALGADGPYTADTTSYRGEVAYAAGKSLKMMAAYATFDQGAADKVVQEDVNLKISYAFDGRLQGLTLTGIGIWVDNNGGVKEKTLEQYRLIMAYPF